MKRDFIMMKKMTKALSLLSVLFLSVIIAGCGEKEEASDQGKTLIVGTSADNPPYTFYSTENGKRSLEGFEIELANLVGKEMGVTIKFQDMDFSALIPSLRAGRADLLMALITPTPERSEKVKFSTIYSRSAPVLLLKKETKSLKESDLQGRRVGVQIASSHLELIKDITTRVEDVDFIIMNRVGELVQELITDRVDCVLLEESVADSFLKTNSNHSLHKAILEDHQVEAAAAFPKDSPWVEKFNAALEVLQQRGDLAALEKKWTQSQ